MTFPLVRAAVLAGMLAVIAGPLRAQQTSANQQAAIDPVSVSPDKYKVLLENEHVRVVEYSIKPGERDQPHTHPPKVSYTAEGGLLRVAFADAASLIDTTETGDVNWAGERPRHTAENVGATPVRIVLFEVKQVTNSASPPAEDRALVGPEDVTVRLENDSVRVMDVVLPPGLKEKPHTHPPYVTYVVTGGKVRIHAADGTTRDSEFKPGDVFFSDRVTHWAEITGNTTVRVLLVEIRRR